MSAPFLTDIDQRIAVKGSRDPLGLQSIWSRLGRQVVGNLTTVTSSVRDFTVTILGVHFAERLRDAGAADQELATFLRWEQLAAYTRAFKNGDTSFRGTDRVKERLLGARRVTLSAEREHQILSNQKIYGLWGLYTVASRASALVELDPLRLTPAAQSMLAASVWPILSRHGDRQGKRLEGILSRTRAAVDLDDVVVDAVAEVLDRRLRAKEREFYRDHLAWGGPTDQTHGEQRQLAALIEEIDTDWKTPLDAQLVRALARQASKQKHDALAEHLNAILTCEAVLAPADLAFVFVLGRDGQTVEQIARDIQSTWGKRVGRVDVDRFAAMLPQVEAALSDAKAAQRWLDIARCLAHGDYGALVHLLLAHNTDVMAARGAGAAWATIEGKKLKVRYPETGHLPGAEELATVFVSSYFLSSLRAVVNQLRGVRA